MKKRIEYEFTANDVAEYVKSFLGNKNQITLAFAQVAVISAHDKFNHCDHGIIAFCESRESERAKIEGSRLLSRFLPIRPDAIPAPPEGWVYAGIGREENGRCNSSEDIIGFDEDNGWGECKCGYLGSSSDCHYAIRWSAPEEVWYRFGLYSPYEGGSMIPRTPGEGLVQS